MPLVGSARAMAIYTAISAQPNFSMLSTAEKAALQTALTAIWGTGDLTYLLTNNAVATADVGTVTSGAGSGGAVVATGTGAFS